MSSTQETLKFLSNATILFEGDSITDCDRNYKSIGSLGQGYVMMISSWFSAMYPEKNVRFVNRGRKGDRVRELKARFQKDLFESKPDIVSILIGINDVLRKDIWNRPTALESFEKDYRQILEQIRSKKNAKPVMIQPFLLDSAERYVYLKKELDVLLKVMGKLSEEFESVLIPLDSIFSEASTKRASYFWASDGVHPTLPGHALIALSWLRIVLNVLP